MVMEFEIAAPARICSVTGRELQSGDAVVSVLMESEGKFVRSDYAAEAWSEPPTGAIAWWPGRIPTSTKPKKPSYNEDVLLDLFRHLSESVDPSRVNFRYVVALLLMRRKRLKFEDLRKVNGQDVLIVRDAKTGMKYDAVDPRLDETAIAGVQDEVFAALGWL
jgi:hypothetical protein